VPEQLRYDVIKGIEVINFIGLQMTCSIIVDKMHHPDDKNITHRWPTHSITCIAIEFILIALYYFNLL